MIKSIIGATSFFIDTFICIVITIIMAFLLNYIVNNSSNDLEIKNKIIVEVSIDKSEKLESLNPKTTKAYLYKVVYKGNEYEILSVSEKLGKDDISLMKKIIGKEKDIK